MTFMAESKAGLRNSRPGPGNSLAGVRPRRVSRISPWAALMALVLPGCSTFDEIFGPGVQAGQTGYVRGFLGGVAAEDPSAALAARDVLSAGGSATDAAIAAGFVMAVTLPSRVGLGGGGACLVFDQKKNTTEAVLFLPGARSGTPAGADRPAAVPMLGRGLFALHTRNPVRPFEELMAPAERLARFGTPVSRALAEDLSAVAGPLLADPGARTVFANADGQPKRQGDQLLQPVLATTLSQLRISGVGDLHQGLLARRLEEASRTVGGNLTIDELRGPGALPSLAPPIVVQGRNSDQVAFLPLPADGGLAAAATYQALKSGQSLEAAAARGQAVAAAWRRQGGSAEALLAANVPASGLGPLPASAGLAVFDRNGNAVSCAFTLNNLFGTGRIVPGFGMLLAAAPGLGQVQPPLLSAGIAWNKNLEALHMVAAGSGQHAAPLAVAGPMARVIEDRIVPIGAVETGRLPPGRGQYGICTGYLPGSQQSCVAISDPQGHGVALGAIDQ
jgi:gamma-glutamyltranspeptidase / glutathione hydrolase